MSCHLCHHITGHDAGCRYFHEENATNAAELRARVDELERVLSPAKVFVVLVYDAAGCFHDYYVHRTLDVAVRQAAIDVVNGRFGYSLSPDDFLTEMKRVIAEVVAEPGVGRRHVRCDAWCAHVDPMELRG